MEAVYQDKNGGFASPEVVKAFQLFPGFRGSTAVSEELFGQYLRGSGRHLPRRQNGISSHGQLGLA
jgi:hypothetical protein